MKKITDFIVNKRNLILAIFVILTGVCLYTSTKVNINSDITRYLPKTSETKIGKDIMDSEFEELKSSTLNVMFKDLSEEEKETTLKELKDIEGVSSVDYNNTEEYNNGKYTLYVINVDDYDHSTTAENIYNTVNKMKPAAMSGTIYDEYKPVLQFWIIALAIGIAMVILTILSESYIEPWLYLASIGIAVFINKGTNIIFPSVSNITDSITAILQLALSMDYSIMLSNRYRQERETEKDKVKAMKKALYDSFKAISSSSVTTIVGLLALVFMSFTIGKDLGFVLAKGVLLSLISIFFCLPGLILMCDKLIMNSKKKAINFNLTKIGKFSYKTRWGQLVFIIAVFTVAYLLKGNLGILYTDSQQDEVGKQFPATNQIAIIYKNEYDNIITEYCKSIENDEKANQVLCYGNTINEKLAYNELNNKFKSLGQDTEIDDYLIKIIYYNYYNKNTKDSMTLNEFISFIKSDVYTNDKISNSINKDIKNNINLLENFATKENVNKKRTISEIANILGMNENDANDILIFYNSKHNNQKMTIKEFVEFMINEVATDPAYASSIDSATLSSLKQLQPFVNAGVINKQMTSSEIAQTFGIDKSMVDQLFLFYRTTQDSTSTMTINQFATFTLSLQTNPTFSTMFNDETIKKLTLLQTLSNEEIINKKYNSNELASILSTMGLNNLEASTINLLYFYNYYLSNIENGIYNTNTKLSLNTFVTNVIMDNNISSLLPSNINSYKPILVKFSNKDFITTKLNSTDMSKELQPFGFTEKQIKMIYAAAYKQNVNPSASDSEAYTNTVIKLTPYELINIIKNQLPANDSRLTQIKLLLNIMDLSYNQNYNIVPTYSYNELTTYLSTIDNSINSSTISLGYSYYDYKNMVDSSYKTMSVKEIINFLITNKDDKVISSQLGDNTDLLSLANIIVNNTTTRYTYKQMATLTAEPESTLKNIYGVADYSGLTTTLSPQQFTNLILDNKDNELLKSKLNSTTINSLQLVKKVMDSTINGTKYSASDLSKLLGTDKDTLSLIMSLYDSKHIKSNQTISLNDFTNFIISDVIPNQKYSSKIDETSKLKLNTVTAIIKNTINGTKYNSQELYNALSRLSNNLDYNLVDIVYIYHGSQNNYDDSWRLTVEQIVNYLNNDLLKDEKYSNFLDEEMKSKISNAQTTINDAKKLLVTDEYSRAIINSRYGAEDKDTFEFIQKTIDSIGQNDGVYVIGDSAMALEMSKSFDSELNFITILTIIFILVVVAFTFKDLLIPLILVLIIQCAVFVTMTILSLTGTDVYFIALLIVQAILMGATIDYAIVYTTYYKEYRETMNIQDAMINAYNKSIHTILSSSSILIIVTLIVSSFAEAIPAKICETISQGTLASVILVIFVLPGVLASFDKIICRKNAYSEPKKNKKSAN